jgi:pimeloyl-ACP methyl ester carboxylesterase
VIKKIVSRLSLLALVALPLTGAGVEAQPPAKPAKPTIVLVHGAFADAAGWGSVIRILQRDGYQVAAVENPLQSLEGDVETTKRLIEGQSGPVVLVGHSYGGAVITAAAAGQAKVTALVYIAAFAPEAGEAVAAFGDRYPNSLGKGLRPDSAGFLYIDPAQFRGLFAADLPEADAAVAAATQKPIHADIFGARVSAAAWKTIPSYYLVTTEDQAINPDLERFYAKRMGATTVEIKSSHVPFVSHPKVVARLIERAAGAAAQ